MKRLGSDRAGRAAVVRIRAARWLVLAVCAAIMGQRASPAEAVVFTDVTAAAGVHYIHYAGTPAIRNRFQAGGAAVGDYDRDGYLDLFVTRLVQPDILFRNKGDGTFEDVSATAFGPNPINAPTNGAAFADLDNDGYLDLYVLTTDHERHYLYHNNGDGTFTEQGIARGAALEQMDGVLFGQSPAVGDYDRDGYLDLFTGEWRSRQWVITEGIQPAHTRLLRNLGAANPGYYEDVTDAAGLNMDHLVLSLNGNPANWEGTIFAFSPRFSDMDRDGRPDLVIAADFQTSRLYWNNGDGTFTDGTDAADVNHDFNGMGSAVGDYNNDGYNDWFVTAIENKNGNALYLNNGDRTFADTTDLAGVRNGGFGWGTSFLDYDNDGDQDLIMTNGLLNAAYANDQMKLWRNNGDGTFTDVSNETGITDTRLGRGLAVFDFDNDGDLDVFVVNERDQGPVLYRNDGGNENHWLRVRAIGAAGNNADGIGVYIDITADLTNPDATQSREIDGGSNYLAHNEHIAHFGLGTDGGTVDRVEITWTNGLKQRFFHVTADTLLTVTLDPDFALHPDASDIDHLVANIGGTHPLFNLDASDGPIDRADVDAFVRQVIGTEYGDINLDRQVNVADLSILARSFGGFGGWAQGDLNGDQRINITDLSILALRYGFRATVPSGEAAGHDVPAPPVAVMLLSAAMILRRTSATYRRPVG